MKRMKIANSLRRTAYLLAVALVLGLFTPRAQSQSVTFTPIDCPDAYSTAAAGINSNGDIVGRYRIAPRRIQCSNGIAPR